MSDNQINVGDQVIVTDKIYGHGFETGDVVTIYALNPRTDVLYGTDGKSKWAFDGSEIAKFEE